MEPGNSGIHLHQDRSFALRSHPSPRRGSICTSQNRSGAQIDRDVAALAAPAYRRAKDAGGRRPSCTPFPRCVHGPHVRTSARHAGPRGYWAQRTTPFLEPLRTLAMITTTPLETLAAFAIVFVAGVVSTAGLGAYIADCGARHSKGGTSGDRVSGRCSRRPALAKACDGSLQRPLRHRPPSSPDVTRWGACHFHPLGKGTSVVLPGPPPPLPQAAPPPAWPWVRRFGSVRPNSTHRPTAAAPFSAPPFSRFHRPRRNGLLANACVPFATLTKPLPRAKPPGSLQSPRAGCKRACSTHPCADG